MRRSLRRSNRKPRRVLMVTGVGLLLLVGLLGLGTRGTHATAHARPSAPAEKVESHAQPDAGHRLPPRPTSVRNG